MVDGVATGDDGDVTSRIEKPRRMPGLFFRVAVVAKYRRLDMRVSCRGSDAREFAHCACGVRSRRARRASRGVRTSREFVADALKIFLARASSPGCDPHRSGRKTFSADAAPSFPGDSVQDHARTRSPPFFVNISLVSGFAHRRLSDGRNSPTLPPRVEVSLSPRYRTGGTMRAMRARVRTPCRRDSHPAHGRFVRRVLRNRCVKRQK